MLVSLNRYIPFPCTSCLRTSNMVTCKNKAKFSDFFYFREHSMKAHHQNSSKCREFQISLSSWQNFASHRSEISLCRNFAWAKIRIGEIRQNENSLPPLLLFFWIAFRWVKWFKRCCFPAHVVFERWNGYITSGARELVTHGQSRVNVFSPKKFDHLPRR